MVEPLFAPVSQFWSAMPTPAVGFVQAPMASAHRPFGTMMSTGMPSQGPTAGGALSTAPAANPIPLDPYAFAGGLMPIFGPSVAAGLSAVGSGPVATTVPALTTPEMAVGVTASALLTAVA